MKTGMADRDIVARRGILPAELPHGIASLRTLPDDDFGQLWESLVLPPGIKERVLAQSVLNFTTRTKVPRSVLPLHGIILLVGPPGTGKTSLAKGAASRAAQALSGLGDFRYIEIDPHALSSSSLGRSQRAVTDLFQGTLVEHSAGRPTIVLLDEVETLLVERSKLSLEANPVDVHRATDAALVQLDRLAEDHPNLLFLATSNFPEAIDSAFVSRADLVLQVPLPDEAAREAILRSTLNGMADSFPAVRDLLASNRLQEVVQLSVGLDGRRIRKLVAAACTIDKMTALDPNRLSVEQLLAAASAMRDEVQPVPVRIS